MAQREEAQEAQPVAYRLMKGGAAMAWCDKRETLESIIRIAGAHYAGATVEPLYTRPAAADAAPEAEDADRATDVALAAPALAAPPSAEGAEAMREAAAKLCEAEERAQLAYRDQPGTSECGIDRSTERAITAGGLASKIRALPAPVAAAGSAEACIAACEALRRPSLSTMDEPEVIAEELGIARCVEAMRALTTASPGAGAAGEVEVTDELVEVAAQAHHKANYAGMWPWETYTDKDPYRQLLLRGTRAALRAALSPTPAAQEEGA